MSAFTALATALLALPGISGFIASYPKIVRSTTTKLNYHPQTFERAVECAQNYGLCDIDELLSLSSGEIQDVFECTQYTFTSFITMPYISMIWFLIKRTLLTDIVTTRDTYLTVSFSELDQFQGCFYEEDREACDKEIHVSVTSFSSFEAIAPDTQFRLS